MKALSCLSLLYLSMYGLFDKENTKVGRNFGTFILSPTSTLSSSFPPLAGDGFSGGWVAK